VSFQLIYGPAADLPPKSIVHSEPLFSAKEPQKEKALDLARGGIREPIDR
jgi:hypothetical protein